MDPDKRKFSRSTPELTNLAAQLVSTRLPSAVAIVPPEHIRGYVHSKKINHYLLGETLGEGSFSKVTEALHILVGEKVSGTECTRMFHAVNIKSGWGLSPYKNCTQVGYRAAGCHEDHRQKRSSTTSIRSQEIYSRGRTYADGSSPKYFTAL